MKGADNDDNIRSTGENEAGNNSISILQVRHARSASVGTVAQSSPLKHPQNQIFFMKSMDSPSSIHSERSRNFHSRKVTRDIAALDFLQNIPMRSEMILLAQDKVDDKQPRDKTEESKKNECRKNFEEYSTEKMQEDQFGAFNHGINEPLAGRRLPGYDATIVTIPSLFRYRFTTKYPAASAVVRRWEGMTAQQGLLESRIFFSSGCGYPVACSTVIKYNGNETNALRKRITSMGNVENLTYDWRGKSYFRLLHSTWASCDKDRDSQDDHPVLVPYLPNYLDDPDFRQGRHRHVVRGDKNIGPVVSSILLFVKPNDLKEELNKKFREKHTWLTSDLSLSKIRNLKREILTSCQRMDLEIATAALACVYFEKLVLNQYVNKSNRKLYMSICFLLAAKFNEPKASDSMNSTIKNILIDIDQIHSIPSREVLTAEFNVYAQLSFSLHVPLSEIQPHFTRLLKCMESNPRKYLDEDVFATYSKLVMEEKNLINGEGANLNRRSFDGGATGDEETDCEVVMSDEEVEGSHSEQEELSTFPWNRVSFAQWWRERRGETRA